jgi:hypothetical protein
MVHDGALDLESAWLDGMVFRDSEQAVGVFFN